MGKKLTLSFYFPAPYLFPSKPFLSKVRKKELNLNLSRLFFIYLFLIDPTCFGCSFLFYCYIRRIIEAAHLPTRTRSSAGA